MVDEHAIKIAVVEEQIKGLREQQRSHAEATNKRLDSIGENIQVLMTNMNKNKGAYAVVVVVSGIISAGILQVISFFSGITPKV